MSKPKLAIASDHAGIELKAFLIQEMKNVEFVDFGPRNHNSVDYPDFAQKACQAVQKGECSRAILICGTGLGMSIAANKMQGIRAAHVESLFTARFAAEHNNANALCLGQRVTVAHNALAMTQAWLEATFESRHQKRLDKISALEGK